MKKAIYIFILYFFYSCSLNIPIEDEITGLDAIDNVDIANETLSGIYNAYPKNKINFSKLADDFYPIHTISDDASDYNLYKWKPKEIIILSTYLWQSHYDVVAKANVLLNRINKIKTNSNSEIENLKFIHAQTLCLKALSYFSLLKLYAPNYSVQNKEKAAIILKNNIASEELPRANLETSYKEIETLLLKAISLFPNKEETLFRFSKKSAESLLAKLYFNWKKYEKAIEFSNHMLINPLDKISYEQVWEKPDKNKEAILVFENKIFNYEPIFDKESHVNKYCVNYKIQYKNTDYRKDINFIEADFRKLDNSLVKLNFLGKSRKNLEDEKAKPILTIRLAELYFIKAESLYKLNKKNEAKNTLNKFLKYRNSSLISKIDESFLNRLLEEKQKEFVGEGHRFFDIKRNKIILQRVNYRNYEVIDEIRPDDFRWLFPIPKNEIKQNKNVTQNPHWEILI